MDPASILKLFAAFALVGINAFFVASEFALVGARRSWVQSRAAQGDRRAKSVLQALSRRDEYFSSLQLGITMASLGLGWLGESAFAALLAPLFAAYGVPGGVVSAHAAATVLAFSIITFLHIVFGELIPRALALQSPERMMLWAVYPLRVLRFVLRPVAGGLTEVSRAVLRLLGVKLAGDSHRPYGSDELRLLVKQAHAGGVLREAEERMLTAVFDFSHKKVISAMTPRTDLVAVREDMGLSELLQFVRADQHTRLPVFRDTLDNIVGILNIKHLMPYVDAPESFVMTAVTRPPLFVPASKPLGDLLVEMQQRVEHLAVVVDEFGGTVGIVTMEDLLEQIVGEIYDEFDVADTTVPVLESGEVVIDGRAQIDQLNVRFGLSLPEDGYHSVGGLIFDELGRVPRVGDVVDVAGVGLTVLEVRARRVAKVRLSLESRVEGRSRVS